MKIFKRFRLAICSLLVLSGCAAPRFDLETYKKSDKAIVLIRGVGINDSNHLRALFTVWRNVKTGVAERLPLPYWEGDASDSRLAFVLPPGIYTLIKMEMNLYYRMDYIANIWEEFVTFEAVAGKVTYVGDLIWDKRKGNLLLKNVNIQDATPVAQALYEKTDLKEAAPYETRLMNFEKSLQLLKLADESMGMLEIER